MEGYARNGRFPADEGHDSEGAPGVGMIKGAGFIETEVKLAHWYELLQVFSVLGAVTALAILSKKTYSLATAWAQH